MTDEQMPVEQIRLDGQVAIVTGGGKGLGRHYALALARRGARVVVNGRGTDDAECEQAVAAEIRAEGGESVAIVADITNESQVGRMMSATLDRWGRIDVLVNNAGFTRDRSFAKLDMADYRAVIDVHLIGAALCTKTAWSTMASQNYGRVIMIGSSAGLAGNFGQAAYSSAKMGLVGLANTLGIEGEAKGIRVNTLSPIGITRMNAHLFSPEVSEVFEPELVTPGLIYLACKGAPNRAILMAGGGSFERAYVSFTRGCKVTGGPEEIARRFAEISDRDRDVIPESAMAQAEIELANAARC